MGRGSTNVQEVRKNVGPYLTIKMSLIFLCTTSITSYGTKLMQEKLEQKPRNKVDELKNKD